MHAWKKIEAFPVIIQKSSACAIVLRKYFKSIIGYSFLLLLLFLLDFFLNVMDLLALLSVSMVESHVKKEQDIFKYSLEYLSLKKCPQNWLFIYSLIKSLLLVIDESSFWTSSDIVLSTYLTFDDFNVSMFHSILIPSNFDCRVLDN